MSIKYPSRGVKLKHSNGNVVEDLSSQATDFRTGWYALGDADWFGIAVDVSGVTGTSPTLDIKVEFSPDDGTTSFSYPDGANSGTQAALTQLTDSVTQAVEYWRNICASQGVIGKVRFFFDFGGTNPSFDFDEATLFYVERGA